MSPPTLKTNLMQTGPWAGAYGAGGAGSGRESGGVSLALLNAGGRNPSSAPQKPHSLSSGTSHSCRVLSLLAAKRRKQTCLSALVGNYVKQQTQGAGTRLQTLIIPAGSTTRNLSMLECFAFQKGTRCKCVRGREMQKSQHTVLLSLTCILQTRNDSTFP